MIKEDNQHRTESDQITFITNNDETTVEIKAGDAIHDFGYQHDVCQYVITSIDNESNEPLPLSEIRLDIPHIKALRDQLNSLDLGA